MLCSQWMYCVTTDGQKVVSADFSVIFKVYLYHNIITYLKGIFVLFFFLLSVNSFCF